MNFGLKFSEVVQFPLAILEIKIQEQPPKWVEDLRNSQLLHYSAHFSKFLYGTAILRVTND